MHHPRQDRPWIDSLEDKDISDRPANRVYALVTEERMMNGLECNQGKVAAAKALEEPG